MSIGALAATAAPALAINPTTGVDQNDGGTGNGISLREAISLTPSGGTIQLQPGTNYAVTATGADDTNAAGDLDIGSAGAAKDLTIVGGGMGSTYILGIDEFGSYTTTDGLLHVVNGSLTLRDLTVSGGQRTGGTGGDIRVGLSAANPAVSLNMTRVTVANGRAANGGGIYVMRPNSGLSQLSMIDSIVTGNVAANEGGGIYNLGNANISRSTISANRAASDGGGMVTGAGSSSQRPVLTAVNMTIAGNTSATQGGGLVNYGKSTIDYSTLANNAVPAGKSGSTIAHGGGEVNIGNSILAARPNSGENCSGTTDIGYQSLGFNLDSAASCVPTTQPDPALPPTPTVTTDRIGIDPQLQDLLVTGVNGVPTYGLSKTSPALDGGESSDYCFATEDARRAPRPQGRACDVGAHEQDQTDVGVVMTDSPIQLRVGELLTYTLVVSNTGKVAAQDVVLTTSTPDGASFVGISDGRCVGTTSIRCNLGAVAAGSSQTITLQVRPNVAGKLANRADISGPTFDTDSRNNKSATTTTVDPPSDAGNGGNGGNGGGNGGGGEVTAPTMSLKLSKGLKKTSKSLKFRITVDKASSLALRLSAPRIGTIGTATAKFTSAGAKTVTLKLSKAQRIALKGLRKGAKMTLRVTGTPDGGTATSSKRLTIKVGKGGKLS